MEAFFPSVNNATFLETELSAVSRMRLLGRAASLFPPFHSFPSPRFQCKAGDIAFIIHSFHSSPLYESTFDFFCLTAALACFFVS